MILVTGATGFVGRHIVAELAGAGYRVRALVRKHSPAHRIAGHVTEFASGDVLDPASLKSAAAGCTAVIHLVAIRREWRERTFAAITAQGAENAVAAAEAAGVSRFILMSALGVTDRPAAGYMKAKLRAEQAVRASRLPHTIFRASFVVGGGGFVAEYGQLIRKAPVVPVPGTGLYPVQPIAVRDVAAAFRRALEVPARGQVYDLAGPERLPFARFIRRIMAAMGVRKPLLRVPLALMRPVASVLQRITPNPPATTDELMMLEAGNVGDPGPAVRDLGLTLTPLDAAIRSAVEELRLRRR